MLQHVNAETVAELADRGMDPFPGGELVGGKFLRRVRAVEVGELRIHGEPPAGCC